MKTKIEYQYEKFNELLDWTARFRIPGETRQIFDVIVRKTIGWNKRKDWISLSQFECFTGKKISNISRSLKILHEHRLIVIEKDKEGKKHFGINKRFSEWIPFSEKSRESNQIKGEITSDKKSASVLSTTKDTTKEPLQERDGVLNENAHKKDVEPSDTKPEGLKKILRELKITGRPGEKAG